MLKRRLVRLGGDFHTGKAVQLSLGNYRKIPNNQGARRESGTLVVLGCKINRLSYWTLVAYCAIYSPVN